MLAAVARRDLPLCPACGAWRTPCEHAREPRLRWRAEPLGRYLGEGLGHVAFAVFFTLLLVGTGPLIFWLMYGWPPRDWIEWIGAIGVAIVSLPGLLVGIGVLVSTVTEREGRRWALIDAAPRPDEAIHGEVFVRGGRPLRGAASRTLSAGVSAPAGAWLSSETAMARTDDPVKVAAAALVGMLARDELALVRADTRGWTMAGGERSPVAVRSFTLVGGAAAASSPWIEQLWLATLGRGLDLAAVAQAVGGSLAGELEGVTSLREILDVPPPVEDPGPLEEALAGWRAQGPEVAEAALAGLRAGLDGPRFE